MNLKGFHVCIKTLVIDDKNNSATKRCFKKKKEGSS